MTAAKETSVNIVFIVYAHRAKAEARALSQGVIGHRSLARALV